MSGLAAIIDGIAASLDPLTAEVAGLQITAFMNPSPSPPSLDVYPADVSGLPVSQYGWEEMVTVRARMTTPDDVAAQELLLSMMDADGPTSVISMLQADPTFGGVVGGSAVDERSGFQPYPGDYFGCEWRVRTIQ
jgi:hypothetical protein